VAARPFGYDEGLYLEVPHLKLTLNGDLQARYTGVVRPEGTTGSTSDFDLHHGRVRLTAQLVQVVTMVAEFDFGSEFVGSGKFAPVRDLYAELRPVSWLSIRGGQFKIPLSREMLVDDLLLTFVDRSLATRAFGFDRDLGVQVAASLLNERLLLQAAVTDGVEAPFSSHNDNFDLAYTARVVAQPLGPLALREGDPERSRDARFSFGGAFHYDLQPTDRAPPANDLDRDGVIDNVEVLTAAAEAALSVRGFALEGEYFFRRERSGGGLADRSYHGGYAQASAMLFRGLQLAARYSYAQPHALRSPPLGILGDVPRAAHEASAMVSWFQFGDRLRATVEYDFRDDAAADPSDRRLHRGHLFAAQVQAGF
jgi:hypothetical protein